MNTHHIFFAIFTYALLITTAYFLRNSIKIGSFKNRFESLDGFRGILAISVFIHHAAVWKYYIETENWMPPKEIFYSHLGSTSVSFFFMITSFLFTNKLIKDYQNKDFDAKAFFISRIFRIVPLYYFSVILIFILSLAATHFQIVSTYKDFLITAFHWATFNIFNKISFNQFHSLILVNSSVEWSLAYEWFFYFTIPLLAATFVKSVPKKIILSFISLTFIFLFLKYHHILPLPMLSFLSGAIAPFILKFAPILFTKFAQRKIISLSIILLVLYLLNSERPFVNFVITSYIFTMIALGNTIFGVLKSQVLKFLGEISYSTYLLHGIILFLVLYLVIGLENIKKYTDSQYCLVIFAVAPLVILVSTLTYKYIEAPFIKFGKKIIRNLPNEKA